MRPRLSVVKPMTPVVRDHLGLWAMWILLASGCLWFMSLSAVRPYYQFVIAMLLAVTFLGVFARVLPSRRDGRLLPQRASATCLVIGFVVSALYLWMH